MTDYNKFDNELPPLHHDQYRMTCTGCYTDFILLRSNIDYILHNNMRYCSCPVCRQYIPIKLRRKLRDKQGHSFWINGIGKVENPVELSEYTELKNERERKRWEKEEKSIDK